MPCMDLHLDCPDLNVTEVLDRARIANVTIDAEMTTSTATCPNCGHDSARVHSRYRRTITDLPSRGRRLVDRLTPLAASTAPDGSVAAGFSVNSCPAWQRHMPEHKLPVDRIAPRHRLCPRRRRQGTAGQKLAMPTSPDTLLRRVNWLRSSRPAAAVCRRR